MIWAYRKGNRSREYYQLVVHIEIEHTLFYVALSRGLSTLLLICFHGVEVILNPILSPQAFIKTARSRDRGSSSLQSESVLLILSQDLAFSG